jgi:hypothetical protein
MLQKNKEGANMNDKNRGAKDEQHEEHSLPGTNQAGKEAGSGGSELHDTASSGGHPHDQLDEHSLPGTNQASKPMKKPSAV